MKDARPLFCLKIHDLRAFAFGALPTSYAQDSLRKSIRVLNDPELARLPNAEFLSSTYRLTHQIEEDLS